MIIYISLQGLLVKGLRRRPLTAKTGVRFSYKLLLRGVAQFGRALRSGRRGRKFKSCRLDCLLGKENKIWLVGQGVKTSPSHGENRSSILLQAAMCPAKAGLFLFCSDFS